MALLEIIPAWVREIPEHLKMQEMCDKAVDMELCSLAYVSYRFKTEEMCKEAVHREPYTLPYVHDHFNHFKTQEMCNEAMHENQTAFFLFPDRFETEEMSIKAVEVDP